MTEREERIEHPFQLRPFTAPSAAEGLAISGTLDRHHGKILIKYRVEGKLDQIGWPAPCSVVCRCQQLWRQTCFEFFFGIPGQSAYWEVNLAPNRCWNVYHFTGYRQTMREEETVGLPFCVAALDTTLFTLDCRIDIHRLVPDWSGLEVAVAAVILDRTGEAGYWAIDHPAKGPDFHDRRSFLVNLPEMNLMVG